MTRLAHLLFLGCTACQPTTASASGAYLHAPWFGEASIFHLRNKPLSQRNLAQHFSTLRRALEPRASLAVSVLPTSGAIQATWSNLKQSSGTRNHDDLIVLTCGDRQDWPLAEVFDAVNVVVVSNELVGTGKQILPNRTALPDVRCQYVVRYIRSETSSATGAKEGVIVAEALLLQEFGLLPSSLHLGFTEKVDEMLVSWVSGHSDPIPQVGNDQHGWSDETSFQSRLPLDADAVKFIMYADQALPVPYFEEAWRMTGQVVGAINAGYNGFLLHPGDLGYAEGSGAIWDVWGGLIQPISSRLAYQVTVGNHEYDHVGLKPESSGAPPGGWYDEPNYLKLEDTGTDGVLHPLVTAPGGMLRPAGTTRHGTLHFTPLWGGVHVVVLSSEHDWRSNGSRQYTWLENDLKGVNRVETPWIVIATHRMTDLEPDVFPLKFIPFLFPTMILVYTTQLNEEGDYLVSLGFRENVEPLLKEYKVNLMLVGHQHSYERSCPVYNGTCAKDGMSGTTHMVVGSAGATHERGNFSNKLGNWSLKHVDDYGFIRVDANRSRLQVDFVRTNGQGNISHGQVWDSVNVLPWP
eukprot:gene4824-10080_t